MIEIVCYIILFLSLCGVLWVVWYCDNIDYVAEPEETKSEAKCREIKRKLYELSKLR